jgi:hypothetical protein
MIYTSPKSTSINHTTTNLAATSTPTPKNMHTQEILSFLSLSQENHTTFLLQVDEYDDMLVNNFDMDI